MRPKKDIDISENLCKAMAAKCIKASELAEMLDVSPQLVNQYKHGKAAPSFKNLVAMCNIFNVSTDWMLGLTACRTPDAFDLLPEQTRADLQTILNSPKRDKLLRLCAEVIEE